MHFEDVFVKRERYLHNRVKVSYFLRDLNFQL
uniref:Uncharacterized protein n=1 Tax=Anguilla anguilla TaxID=7936 RepID=A0A0E9RI75_ANGAN